MSRQQTSPTAPAAQFPAAKNASAGYPARRYAPWTADEDATVALLYQPGVVTAQATADRLDRTASAVAARRARTGKAPATHCPCGKELIQPAGRGRKKVYCSENCRHTFNEQRHQLAVRAAVAAAQQPCLHCGTDIVPGARAKQFCTKSCAKKYGYQQKKRAATAAAGRGA